MSFPRHQYLTLAVVLGVAIYCIVAIANLSDGHNWGDDFALYISHARNLATGRPYAETGFIQNPLYPYLAITYAPPIAPIILAPVYVAFGLNLVAMKAALVLFFGATLLVIYFYYSALKSPVDAALVTAAMALNPYLWRFKDNVVTEFIFLFFLWLALLFLEIRERAPSLSGRLVAAGCAGAAAYFATGTREIGLVLVPAVIVYDLLFRRRLGLDTALFLVVFFVGYGGQSLLLGLNIDQAYIGEDEGYATLLVGWSNSFENVFHYVYALRVYFPAPYFLFVPLTAVFLACAVMGLYREWTRYVPPGQPLRIADVLRGIRLQDVLAAGYLAAICLQPFRATRYLMPVIPILFFYIVVGARAAVDRLAPATWSSAAVVLAAMLIYHTGYFLTAKADRTAQQGIHNPQSVELFNAVRTQLPKDAVVIFRKPRAMALYGQRRSAVWPTTKAANEETAWKNLAQLGATHLVIPREATGLGSPPYLRYDRGPTPAFLQAVFANDHFTVYRILHYPQPGELASSMQR